MKSKWKLVLPIAAVLLLVSLLAPAVALAQTTTATRDIADQSPAPGTTIQVTVTIDVDEAEALALDENPPAGWTLTRVSEAPAASIYNANTNEWVWFQAAVGTITVVYNLTVPTDAASSVYPLTGTIGGEVWSEPVDGENTITVSGVVVPFSLTTTLLDGWSLLSTPVLLDANSDSLGQIFDAQSLSNIDIFYSWNGEIFVEALDNYELLPLDAIYVNVMSDASAVAEFFPSQELSGLPSRGLQEGLNLFGPAPALENGVPQVMPLDQALVSVEQAPGGTGYTMVISPAYNQTGWTYALGGGVRNLLPYEGYWVVMDNGDTLYGFSTTPIPE